MKLAFKAFMVILLIQLSAIFVACSTEEELAKQKAETFYLDENFILVDRKETITYDADNNKPTKIRIWVIYRVVPHSPDSIDVAEIMSQADGNSRDFSITTDLWFNKPVGSVLHFDYIRKNRFFRTSKEKLGIATSTVEMPYSGTTTVTSIPISTDAEKLEIERKIISLETELESLKRKLNN